jgi:hypothetical protein
MEFIYYLIDFILNIDTHLNEIIFNYGTLTYFILFAIVFAETGLVIAPFLPGRNYNNICYSGSSRFYTPQEREIIPEGIISPEDLTAYQYLLHQVLYPMPA